MKKICTNCKKDKNLSLFSNHPKGKFGKHPQCNDCRNKKYREYYRENATSILSKQKRRDRYNPNYERKKKYGLSTGDYELMLFSQNKKCKICNDEEKLVVDHNHKNNKVRGLLCSRCNRGLGQFLDDIELLKKAIEYLVGSP